MNSKHKLGLPIEYQQNPEYFDAHNINEKTEARNALIEKLLKAQKVKTILDMTCGTGSQVFHLAKHGYEIIGSDFSPDLLKQARQKAAAKNLDLKFIDGDMRDIKLGKFDAVITIFSAIGHLTQADFEKTLQNIRTNLKEGGIYIFDIFNLQALTDEVLAGFKMDIKEVINGVKIHNIQYSELDQDKGLLTSHDHYTISKDDTAPEIKTNTFSLKIYTAKQLQEILNRNNFEILQQYDIDGNDFNAEKSLNILTVAKKSHTKK